MGVDEVRGAAVQLAAKPLNEAKEGDEVAVVVSWNENVAAADATDNCWLLATVAGVCGQKSENEDEAVLDDDADVDNDEAFDCHREGLAVRASGAGVGCSKCKFMWVDQRLGFAGVAKCIFRLWVLVLFSVARAWVLEFFRRLINVLLPTVVSVLK